MTPPMPTKLRVSGVQQSPNGLFEARWPRGDKPSSGAVLAGDANAAASAIADLASGNTETWEAQLLRTGTTGLALDIASGNTVTWRTDEAEPYARVTWNNAGTNWINYSLVDRTKKFVRVRFWARHSVANKGTKHCKIFGQGYPTDYHNVTFGRPGGYASTTWGVYYSDVASGTGAHDVDVEMGFDGILTGGSSYSQAAPRFLTTSTINVDTNWHKFDYYLLMSDDGVPNGEMIAMIDDAVAFHVDQQYNCGAGRQLRDFISLLNYSDQSGFYVDIKKLDVGYDRPQEWQLTPIYTSDFESMTTGAVASGGIFSGTGAGENVGSAPAAIRVRTTQPYAGTKSLEFYYPAGIAQVEQDFNLGADYTEVDMQFKLYVPANYSHPTSNNKLLRIGAVYPATGSAGNNGDITRYGLSFEPGSGATNIGMEWDENDGALMDNRHSVTNAITDADKGTWIDWRFHLRQATAKGSGKGLFDVYKNGVLVGSVTPDTFIAGAYNVFHWGYLFGFANSPFAADTRFYIDNLRVYAR